MPSGFAPLIKTIRIKRHLTQAEFARIIGVPISTYKSWEYRVCLPSLSNLTMLETRLASSADKIEEAYMSQKLR